SSVTCSPGAAHGRRWITHSGACSTSRRSRSWGGWSTSRARRAPRVWPRSPTRSTCRALPRSSTAPRSPPAEPHATLSAQLKLKGLAERIGGRLEGDSDVEILRVASTRDAAPGDLTFVANGKYASDVARTRASAVIVGEAAAPELFPACCALLRSADP